MVFYPFFVHPIAVVYIVSGVSRPGTRLLTYLFTTLLAMLVGSITAFILGFPEGWLPLAIAFAYSAPAPLLALLPAKQSSFRLSMLLAVVAYAGTALVVGASWWYGLSVLLGGVSFVAFYAVTMIYAVSIHSLPRTYRDEPSAPLSILLAVLVALSALVFAAGRFEWARIIYGITVFSFIGAARLDRIGYWYRSIDESAPAARPGHRYFLQGHMFAVPLMLLASYYMVRPWSGALDALATLHALTIGFTGVFIYIHAPMMLPVLLSVKTKRRYNMIPYILLAGAAFAWPGAGFVAGLLFIASLIALAYIVV